MNFKQFREKLSPISDLLKSEGDKLRGVFAETSSRYSQANQALQALQTAPPHRAELEALLAAALAKWNARCADDLNRLVGGWRTTPLQSRPSTADQAVDNLLHQAAVGAQPPLLALLAGADFQARLTAIVGQLPWADDGPLPAERASLIKDLEKSQEVLSAELSELAAIAEGAGIKLR